MQFFKIFAMIGLIAQGAIAATAVNSSISSVATTLSTSILSATTVTGVETSSPKSRADQSVQWFPECFDATDLVICQLHGFRYRCNGFGQLSVVAGDAGHNDCFSDEDPTHPGGMCYCEARVGICTGCI